MENPGNSGTSFFQMYIVLQHNNPTGNKLTLIKVRLHLIASTYFSVEKSYIQMSSVFWKGCDLHDI